MMVKAYCEDVDADSEWDAVDIVGICIVYFLGLLVVSGTAYEVLMKNDGKQQTGLGSFALCFSALSNTQKIFDCTPLKPGSTVPILDGLRFFSFMWVITGHCFTLIIYNLDNMGSLESLLE